jgi:hypothetical protein
MQIHGLGAEKPHSWDRKTVLGRRSGEAMGGSPGLKAIVDNLEKKSRSVTRKRICRGFNAVFDMVGGIQTVDPTEYKPPPNKG